MTGIKPRPAALEHIDLVCAHAALRDYEKQWGRLAAAAGTPAMRQALESARDQVRRTTSRVAALINAPFPHPEPDEEAHAN